MLSRAAWNGLLKTLEEPPEKVLFLFCTTEPQKVPITITSRCQRFDLHRVAAKELLENLKRISKIENGNISNDALVLLSKVAAGSVRDSLSLLDRVLVTQDHEKKEISANDVREMLGIADRSKILEILQLLIQGDQEKAIMKLRKLINEGLDPYNFLNDLLENIHFALQKKELKDSNNDLPLSESENEMINFISNATNTSTLIIFWQFILKSLDELSIVSNQILLLEMLIIRLLHLKEIPSYESLLETLKKNNSNEMEKEIKTTNLMGRNEKNKISKDQIKTTTQTKLDSDLLKEKAFSDSNLDSKKINSFEELIHLSTVKKEIGLKYDLERNVNLVKFSDGKIDISFNEKLGKDFVRKLSEKLHEWTGKRWVISLTKEIGQKSFVEKKIIKNNKVLEEEKKNEVYKKFKNLFPDAELVNVEEKD
jgi:DNA polymerase-3 subunit gamma/tau